MNVSMFTDYLDPSLVAELHFGVYFGRKLTSGIDFLQLLWGHSAFPVASFQLPAHGVEGVVFYRTLCASAWGALFPPLLVHNCLLGHIAPFGAVILGDHFHLDAYSENRCPAHKSHHRNFSYDRCKFACNDYGMCKFAHMRTCHVLWNCIAGLSHLVAPSIYTHAVDMTSPSSIAFCMLLSSLLKYLPQKTQ